MTGVAPASALLLSVRLSGAPPAALPVAAAVAAPFISAGNC